MGSGRIMNKLVILINHATKVNAVTALQHKYSGVKSKYLKVKAM
jgi:hypothetical protein